MLNVSDYLLTNEKPRKTPKKNTLEKRLTEPFLRGPIPLKWIDKASELNGSALKVGLKLWYLSGLNKQNPTVTLRKKDCEKIGLSRQARYRALKSLEDAGLISVKQSAGRLPVLTILSAK